MVNVYVHCVYLCNVVTVVFVLGVLFSLSLSSCHFLRLSIFQTSHLDTCVQLPTILLLGTATADK